LLETISFSYQPFHTPKEIAYWQDGSYVFSVQEYIDQTSSFIERPLEEQFTFALDAFKTQASARATTASHYCSIASTFGIRTSSDYVQMAQNFIATLKPDTTSHQVIETCERAFLVLQKNQERIEQYCGFLTHTDFVPHNFRIQAGTMFLLDTASLEFGNKHESWARFLNFMTLYNRKLENLLLTYIEKNRSSEEQESLQLMRIYRLIEIITYYVGVTNKSTDDLKDLNQARVQFWHEVLQAELRNERVEAGVVESYRITRDRLRSQSEKERQKNLH